MNYIVFGTIGTAAPFNEGRTTTGRIAMYLGLHHIWGDSYGCASDDGIADTPIQEGPNFGKVDFPHVSCGNGPHGDMFMNFLDYTDDSVACMFTKGQVVRMNQTLDTHRAGLARLVE